MAKTRKDKNGRVLRTGECERTNGTNCYAYTDVFGRRHFVYAKTLGELREKEKNILRDQLDGIQSYNSNVTLNTMFDRFMSTKGNIRETTRNVYHTLYDNHIRRTLGMREIRQIKYSTLKVFFADLSNQGISYQYLRNMHHLVSSCLALAVRDNLIRSNPAIDVLKDVKKSPVKNKTPLSLREQQIFLQYVKQSTRYSSFYPMFVILLGTGCRIGELLGLCWSNVDFETRIISIDHGLVLVQDKEKKGRKKLKIHPTKTRSGTRKIPMIDAVYDAFQFLRKKQEETGMTSITVDGRSDFVFFNPDTGKLYYSSRINQVLKNVCIQYNQQEKTQAESENREPEFLPFFSPHILRHTFCSNLCENEANLKVIQELMGHNEISTTMDIYTKLTVDRKKMTMTDLSQKLNIVF